MELIPSFSVDHTRIIPGIFESRVDTLGVEMVTTFDVRLKKPNREPSVDPAAMHTMEHVVATYLRNHPEWKDKLVYWGPMCCLTGFYIIVKGRPAAADMYPVILEAFRYTAYFGLLLFSLIPFLLAMFSFMPGTVRKIIAAAIRLGGRLKLVKNTEETTARVISMMDSYHASFSVIARDKPTLIALFLLSLVYRIALCSMPYFVLKMFSAPVTFIPIFAATVYIYASIALVPTPGNAGAAEGAFYLVFSAMGSDGVFWAMLIWRLFSHYSFIIIGALIYGVNALQSRRKRKGETA